MSFDIFEAFATDEHLENTGVKFPLGKGASLTIARSDNRAYAKALTKAIETHRDALAGDDDSVAQLSDEIMINVMANTILLGWSNLTYKGEPVGDYSVEKAKKLLAVKDFRKLVASKADQMGAYKVKSEVATGND